MSVQMNMECKDGYKASRWTKEVKGNLKDRIYVDGPTGSLGYFEMSKNDPNQGSFVLARDSREEFGLVDEETNATVTVTGPGGYSVLLGPSGRTDAKGKILTREEQITLGLCMNVSSRLLPETEDLTGKDDAYIAQRVIDMAQTIFDLYM